MLKRSGFDYQTAMHRNLGLVSEAEQQCLRRARVALAGAGGVGGAHLQALARLGVGAFHLADPDTFEIVNFNRQLGADIETVGRDKAEVLAATARAINPDCEVKTFLDGVTEENVEDFLSGVDVVLDGIEFYAIEARRMLHAACWKRGVPVVIAGPMGYGASVLVFTSDGPSFDTFFGIEEAMTRAERLMAFALGLMPRWMLGDVDPSRVDVEAEKGPALASACLLCGAAAATEVLKLVCGRGRPRFAPCGTYYDPWRGRTLRLRPRPSLRHSLRGRLLRWFCFRRFPEARAMHQGEMAARTLKDTKTLRTGTGPSWSQAGAES